nr:hypothetical protein [Desulfobacterales bacterium]
MLTGQDEDIAAFRREELSRLLAAFEEEYLFRLKSDSKNLRAELEEFVFPHVKETFGLWHRAETDRVASAVETVQREFSENANRAIQGIIELI